MRILLDTNIVLDVLLKREPWVAEAKTVWQANDDGLIVGYITASTVADIFYIARRIAGLDVARAAVQTCLKAFEVCVVDRVALERASALPGDDFEDNLQIACAEIAKLDAIVTRDPTGFKAAAVPILTLTETLARL